MALLSFEEVPVGGKFKDIALTGETFIKLGGTSARSTSFDPTGPADYFGPDEIVDYLGDTP